MTNRQTFVGRGAPPPSSGPISNDLPRPVPVVPVAKPRGKIQSGGEGPSNSSSNHPLRMEVSPNHTNHNNNNNPDSIDVDTITNGNHPINQMKSIQSIKNGNMVNGKRNERKSDNNNGVVVDAVDEVVTYQNAPSVSPSSINIQNTPSHHKRRPAPPPRDTDTMTKTKAILNEAADAVAKSFAKQTQGINKGTKVNQHSTFL